VEKVGDNAEDKLHPKKEKLLTPLKHAQCPNVLGAPHFSPVIACSSPPGSLFLKLEENYSGEAPRKRYSQFA